MNVFYTASKNGKSHSGFIDAENNKSALEKLTTHGYQDICFHNDVIGSLIDKKYQDDEVSAKINSEINTQFGYGFFLRNLIWASRWALSLLLVALLLAVHYQSWYVVSAIGLIVVTTFGVAIYRFGYSMAFNKLLDAYVYGRWEEFPDLLQKVNKLKKFPDVIVELALYEAKYWVAQGNFDKAISLMAVHETALKEVQPGGFESRMATLYFQDGEVDQFLEWMRRSKGQCGGLPLFILDWALAEAKYGDHNQIDDHIDMINQEPFSEMVLVAKDFLNALLLFKKEDEKCLSLFADSAVAMEKFKAAPLSRLLMNDIKQYHAFALYQFGNQDEAKKMALSAWRIASIHASEKEKLLLVRIMGS